MFRIPISIITVWHPEHFWKLPQGDLYGLPSLKKNRQEQELRKADLAQQRALKMTRDFMHHRTIINFGEPKYSFRKTWLDGNNILDVISDYSMRLIDTEETGRQARFRVEVRPNWGTEPNVLPNDVVEKMKIALLECRVSVRQLWINPFTIDTSKLPKGPFYDINHTANLAIGPYDERDCVRKANIRFRRHPESVAIHQHSPFYKGYINIDEIRIIPGCSMWFAEYD